MEPIYSKYGFLLPSFTVIALLIVGAIWLIERVHLTSANLTNALD